MMKIAITGPECVGKTTLSLALAKHYDTHVVSEYARTYLANKLDDPYTCLLYTSPSHETVLDLVCRLLLEKKK